MNAGQRLPCAGLFLCAIVGIVTASATPASVTLWVGLAGIFLAGGAWRRTAWMVWPAAACAFAALHLAQSRDSPGAMLAERIGASAVWDVRADEPPAVSASGRQSRFRGSVRVGNGVWARVAVVWRGPSPPGYGEIVRISGRLGPIEGARNPGAFDPIPWYQLDGIYAELTADAFDGVERIGAQRNPIRSLAYATRNWVATTLALGIEDTVEAQVIRGMTLGDTRGTPSALSDAFREVGVFHLFSVSGLHVGMIAAILWGALGMLGVNARRAAWILIPCVFFYAVLTGWKPAGVRAATMVSAIALGLVLHRQPMPLNSLCAAGLLLLGINSNELFNPGFQLSFSVVGAILLLGRPIYRRIERLSAPDPFIPRVLLPWWRIRLWEGSLAIGGLFAICAAAWIGSLPLTLSLFHLITPIGLAANLIAVPMAFLVLTLSMLSLSVAWIAPGLAIIFNNANLAVTAGLVAVVQGFAAIPGGHFYVAAPLPADTIARITVMDFGSGGATVLRTHDGVWLIDGGDTYSGSQVMVPYLRSLGVNRLNGVFLTHGDAKHLGGLIEVLQTIPTKIAFDSSVTDRSPTRRRLRAFLEDQDVPIRAVEPGNTVQISPNAELRVLYPPSDLTHPLADEKALVLMLITPTCRVLFLSDAGEETEAALLASEAPIEADIVVKGHPNDGGSGMAEFLDAVAPRLVVQTASRFSGSGGVSPALRLHAKRRAIPLWVQSQTGAVEIEISTSGSEAASYLDPSVRLSLPTDQAQRRINALPPLQEAVAPARR